MAEVYSPWSLYEKPTPFKVEGGLNTALWTEFVRNDRSWAREQDLSVQIYGAHIAGLPYSEALQRALDVFLTINNIHYPTRGKSLSKVDADAKLSSVILHITEQVALEHAVGVPEDYLNKLQLQSEVLGSTSNITQWDRWFYPKISSLYGSLRIWKWMIPWIDGLQERIGQAVSGKKAEIRDDADIVWQQLQADRGYGVKTCFYESPLFLDPGHAFFVLDESLNVDDPVLRRGYLSPDIAAVIGIGERPRLGQDLTPAVHRYQSGIVKYNRIQVIANHGLYPVTNEGDIRSSVQSYNSLREVFRSREAEGVYDLFRVFTFLRLYDLTARPELVDKLPSLDKLEREIARNREWFGLGKKVKPFNYKQLLLPRTKLIIEEEASEPTAVTKNEVTNADQPGEGLKRFVDKHHVTWFVRKLPKNYHASEMAKEFAKEHKVSLEDDETIVRDHWRGNRIPEVNRPTKAKFKR